ncbi:unnamed protein product, partial [Cylicostephanus goldi]
MIKLLIVMLSLPHVAFAIVGVVFNISKLYMELPPIEAIEFATKAGFDDKGRALLKVLWLFGNLLSDEDKDFFNRLNAKDSGTLLEVYSNTTFTNDEQ